jgi:hypothetical protein
VQLRPGYSRQQDGNRKCSKTQKECVPFIRHPHFRTMTLKQVLAHANKRLKVQLFEEYLALLIWQQILQCKKTSALFYHETGANPPPYSTSSPPPHPTDGFYDISDNE